MCEENGTRAMTGFDLLLLWCHDKRRRRQRLPPRRRLCEWVLQEGYTHTHNHTCAQIYTHTHRFQMARRGDRVVAAIWLFRVKTSENRMRARGGDVSSGRPGKRVVVVVASLRNYGDGATRSLGSRPPRVGTRLWATCCVAQQ